MVLRDFMEIQTPMVMEEIRHAIAVQKALIQTPGFEPEQFYRMDAQMHSLVHSCKATEALGYAPGPAASLYPVSYAGFYYRNRFSKDYRRA